MNHFSSVCKQTKNRGNVHSMQENNLSSDDSLFKIQHYVGSVKAAGEQLCVPLNLSPVKSQPGIKVTCQLVTGTTCNVISREEYLKITKNINSSLEPSSAKLNLYDGSWMKPLGVCRLYTVYNGKSYKLVFQVVPTRLSQKPLLSANTCQKLGLLSVNIDQTVNMAKQSNSGLSAEDIFQNYSDVFTGIGCFEGEYHLDIDTDVKPVQHVPRRIPIALRQELKAKIQDMVKKKVIAKVTTPTQWISSMVVVKKPGKLRVCIDPKDLNKAIRRPKYQIPTIEEILPKLQNAKVFSVLDAKDGFYHVKLDKESSYLTTFWTPQGRYRWLRLPFGISSAPEEYQRRQHEVLEGLDNIEVIADDILLYGCGDTYEDAVKDHDKHLIQLLDRARSVNLKLNKKKLQLKLQEVPYTGHLLTSQGLKPDPKKINAVTEMQKPKNVQELQRFLGFINYLAKFSPHLSDVCEPLRRLTDKEAEWSWQSQQEKAFEEAKKLVTVQPVLKFYSLDDEVTLQCDASEKGLGATLLQNKQPVAFASRALSKTEQRYAQIEKECLAIVFACQRFSQYLTGSDIIHVESDHKPLETIFRKPLLSAPKRLQRMLLQLQRYNLEVQYKKGTEMYIADLLSRAFLQENQSEDPRFDVFCAELESVNHTDYLRVSNKRLVEIQKLTTSDTDLQMLKSIVLRGWPYTKDDVPVCIREYWTIRDELTVQNGILYKGQRVIIPKAMRPEMLIRIHSSHQGAEACLRKARDTLYLPHMSAAVKEVVSKCKACNEYARENPKQPLMTHDVPDQQWSKIAVDLFSVKDKDYLITVDYYSDYWELDTLKGTTTTAIAQRLKHHFSTHGIPDEVVMDNGPQFASDQFAQFTDEWEFNHNPSSPYHSQSNGKVESAVKIAKNMLRKCQRHGNDIYKAILEWRNTPTEGMDTSPVQRLMSRRTRTLIPTSKHLLKAKVAEDVKTKLMIKRQKAKFHFDKHTVNLPELQIGQPIYVKQLPANKENKWKEGTCIDKLSSRSYIVDVDGNEYRRNRTHIKERTETTSDICKDTPVEENIVQPASPAQPRRSTRDKRTTERFQAGFN